MRICFPATSQIHLDRQGLLLEELGKHFDVDVWQPAYQQEGSLLRYVITVAVEFSNFLSQRDYDYILVRADRLELLLVAGVAAYKGIPVIHIEGGAESGGSVIDTKVRNSISMLSDIHLVTDEKAKKRVQSLGLDNVYNVGSLDVSFVNSVKKPKRLIKEDYILLLHHELPEEDTQTVIDVAESFNMKLVGVRGNGDYEKSILTENYSPQDFISLIYHAKCFVGNSSAACKESSILGTPVVLTGSRQDGRVAGHNVLRVPHDKEEIKFAIDYQMKHGRYKRDDVYFKKGTEKEIVKILKSHAVNYPRS